MYLLGHVEAEMHGDVVACLHRCLCLSDGVGKVGALLSGDLKVGLCILENLS